MTNNRIHTCTALLCALSFNHPLATSAQGVAECTAIGLPATCHSCLHALAGPFGDVGAQAHDASFIYSALNTPHTYYRVTLMASASLGPFAGAALYYPNSDEPTELAFYRASDYTIRVFDDQGVEQMPQASFTIDPGATDCASVGYSSMFDCAALLPYADVFLLNAVEHTVRFEGASEATIGVVIENLGSIGGSYYPDGDNDGHGAYEPSLDTWCVPPDGYLDDSSDCNDANASVHDGATEVCNGIDDDCDEVVDEVECAMADAGTDAAMDDEDAGEETTADASVDAGDEDSATAVSDASIAVDAGEEHDAASATDAAVNDSGVDATVPDGKLSSGGCSCNLVASPVGSTGPGVLHVLGLLTLGAWRLRRRRLPKGGAKRGQAVIPCVLALLVGSAGCSNDDSDPAAMADASAGASGVGGTGASGAGGASGDAGELLDANRDAQAEEDASTQAMDGGAGLTDSGAEAGTDADTEPPPVAAERWLAFQVEQQDDYTHPLFLVGVPAGPEAIQLAPDVEFYKWSADGRRLIYGTPGSVDPYTPNAAYQVTVSATRIGEPELLHEPLNENTFVGAATISPDGQTLALQLVDTDAGMSHWYLRSTTSTVEDWIPVGYGSIHLPQRPIQADARFAWAPDGSRIAIVEKESNSHDLLLIVDATGQWTEASYEDLDLIGWSADGKHLLANAFYFAPLQQRALFVVDAEAAYDVVTITEPGVHRPDEFARFSPDGSAIAFKADVADEYSDLFVKTLQSADPPLKIDGLNAQDAAWLSTSDGLIYWGYGPGEATGPYLYVVPKQGGDFTRLNPDATLASCNQPPCFLPAGPSFVFTTLDDEQTGNQLYDIDPSGSAPVARALTSFPVGVFVNTFVVGPDPTKVLMIVTNAEGEHTIYKVDRSDAEPGLLPVIELSDGADPWFPSSPWSSDSRFFFYTANHDRDRNGNADLLIADLHDMTSGDLRPVTDNDGSFYVFNATWQP